MKKLLYIFGFLLLSLACAQGQTVNLSNPTTDPVVKPEQLTATIVHYQKMRLTARRSIRMLVLALQNTEGSTARLNEAINNEQDIVDWANWCIVALRDNTDNALTCAFPPGLNSEAKSESVCRAAENASLASCAPKTAAAKRTEPTVKTSD